MAVTNIDALDEQILKMIAGNARIPFLEVARACHVSGAAIHQRIQKLVQQGVIKGSQFRHVRLWVCSSRILPISIG